MCDAAGGILFGPGATTLPRAAALALAAAGDRRPVLTPIAERLLVLEAGEAAGGPLANLAPDAGLAGALARVVGELRRGEVTAEDLRRAGAELEGAPARRLMLVADALAAYEVRLAEAGALDAPAAVRAAATAVRRKAWPEGRLDRLALDGLCAAGPGEWELVVALVARARATRVRVPYVPERPDVCGPAEPFLRRIESLHELAATSDIELVLDGLDDDRAPRLAAVLAAVAGGTGDRAPVGGGIVLAAPGAGAAGEVESAADAVLSLVERHGLAPDEILAVAPSPRSVAPALGAALRARGLAFAGGGPAAGRVPVVQFVLGLLAAAGPLERSHAARLASSAWLGAELPGLGRLLERAGALDGRGSAAAALRRRAAALTGGRVARERAALSAAARRLEALEAGLAPLALPGPARVHARHLSALVAELGLRRRAARGPLEVAARDLEALSALEEAAGDVARGAALAGRAEAALAPAAFAALLRRALEARALSAPGEPAAGAVELVGLEEAACASSRAVVLLGCAEGALPPPAPAEPLLRDPERLAVNRLLHRGALAVAGGRRAEAVHRSFMAMAAAREALVFSWAAPGPGGDGGPPAPIVLEALAAAGVTAPARPPGEPPLAAARTQRAALRAAARGGRAGAAALAGTALAARAGAAEARGEIERARRAAVLAGVPAPHAGGVGGAARERLQEVLPAEWSPSQLEAHARCPFQAFLRTTLGLPDDGEPTLDIEIRDEGTLLHAVLERFVSARIARGAWPPAGGPADQAEARAVAAEVLGRFEREGRTGDPAAWAGRRAAVLHRLDRIVTGEARDHDGLTPLLLEHAFGGGAGAPALELAAPGGGGPVKLKGRIDRVDAGPGRLLVVDYKNAKRGERYEELLDPESFGVSSFQVPAYLMAAARALPGRRLEATFATLRNAERLDPVVLEAGDPRLAPEGGPGSFAAAVVERVERIRRGEFPIVSQGCAHCPFGAVCRFEGVAARRSEESA
jgi:hypothetical protein